MTLWSTLNREVVGALLSVRYDLAQHRHRRRAEALASAETADYSRIALDPRRPQRGPRLEPPRQPRRVVAPTGVALLVAGGAAGTYLAVAGSLSAITADPPGTPVAQPVPPAASTVSAPAKTTPKRPGTIRRPDRRPAVPAPAAEVTPAPTAPTAPEGAGTPENTMPPLETQPTPSATATPTPTPTASATASPTGNPSARPSQRWGHHWRQRAERTPTPTPTQVTPRRPSPRPTNPTPTPAGDSPAGH